MSAAGTGASPFALLAKAKLGVVAILMLVLWYLGSGPAMTADENLLWERVRAAQQHIYQLKQRHGDAPDSEADPWQCGLIGEEWSGITTTLGDLRSKRTACNPAWAVQFKRWFEAQGLEPGDRIAIYSSASFPGLLLSAIAASEAMRLEPLLLVSLGASTWGANQPDYSWPVIAGELRRSGFIHTRADFYTLGGGQEAGLDLSDEGQAIFRKQAGDYDVGLLRADGLGAMVSLKYRLLADYKPRLFVSIGGSHANLGDDYEVLKLPTGPVPPESVESAGNGVIGLAMRDGIPVIHMLNMKHLSMITGIPYDSPPLKMAPTTAGVWFSGAGLLLFFIALLGHRRWKLEPMDTDT